MTSHERISVVEVMGRHCGDIALYSGIASGAEIIVVPEIAFDMDDIVMRINRSRASGKHSNIIVVAEGVMSAEQFAKQLQEVTTYSVVPPVSGTFSAAVRLPWRTECWRHSSAIRRFAFSMKGSETVWSVFTKMKSSIWIS